MTIKIENVRLSYPHLREPEWMAEQRRYAEAWSNATYDRWIKEAMFAAYIKLPFHDTVRIIVGYNPQKLLPSPDADRFREEFLARIAAALNVPIFPKRFHDGGRINRQAEIYATGMMDFLEDDGRRYAPLDFDVSLWNDPDATPLDDLKRMRDTMYEHKVVVVHADIDAAVLQRLLDRSSVRGAIIDIDGPSGEMPGRPESFERLLAQVRKQSREEVARKPNKSYLKHDRTKSHKRRRR